MPRNDAKNALFLPPASKLLLMLVKAAGVDNPQIGGKDRTQVSCG